MPLPAIYTEILGCQCLHCGKLLLYPLNIQYLSCDVCFTNFSLPICTRDPLHCLDLLSKEMAKCEFVREVLEDTKQIVDFLKKDRVDSIRREEIDAGHLTELVTPKKMVENRMITVHLHLESVRRQAEFMASLRSNPKFLKFYNTRRRGDQKEIDQMFRKCHLLIFQSCDVLLTFSIHFAEAHKLCSREDSPLSAWFLIIQALRNGLNSAIQADDGLFDRVLGNGSAQEIMDLLGPRFNMDGKKPAGQRVGLIDDYHLWAHLVDPHVGEWRARVILPRSVREIAKDMIDFFIPPDEDGGSTNREAMMKEFEVSQLHLIEQFF